MSLQDEFYELSNGEATIDEGDRFVCLNGDGDGLEVYWVDEGAEILVGTMYGLENQQDIKRVLYLMTDELYYLE